MAIQKEIWQNHIISNLYRNCHWMKNAFDASGYVLNGKVVHLPNAGLPIAITRNRSSLPATASQRTDIDITYTLAELSSDPLIVTSLEEYESSYDKIENVLSEMMSSIRATAGDWLAYEWRPQSGSTAGINTYVKTTGSYTTSHLPGTLGTRKKVTLADLASARLILNKQNIPTENRYCLIDSDMLDQLMSEVTVTNYRDSSKNFDLAEGAVTRLYGFDIYERSYVLAANSATTNPSFYAPANVMSYTSDTSVALCWQKDAAESALGSVDFYEDISNPLYYGNIYSSSLRYGGRARRNDYKGVVALVQSL